MALFIREIIPSSTISDASLIPNFTLESEQDVLAIARGNILYIYQIGNIQDSLPVFYEFNNPIKLVRPIYNDVSTNSNILIIFANYRACILGPNGESILNFSLSATNDISNPIKVKCALHPELIAIQTLPNYIEIYSKTDNSLLKYATSISIGCKSIIDFCFIGPTIKVMQLAVLIEEFNERPRLQIIDIDSSDWSYREEPEKSVSLSNDSYLLFPINPEQLSTVVVLNSNQCLRITQKNDGLKVTSATICTADKIINCDHLHHDIFCYIDETGNFGFVEIKRKGTVHFESVGNSDKPFKIIALTHNLMFSASHESLSKVFKLKKDNSVKIIRTFQIAGSIKSVSKNNNNYMGISDRGNISIKPVEKVDIFEKINLSGGIKIFSNKNSIIVSKINETIEIGSDGNVVQDSLFNTNEKTIFFNGIVHCTESRLQIAQKDAINDKFLICDASKKFVVYYNDKKEIHLFSLFAEKDTDSEKIEYREIPFSYKYVGLESFYKEKIKEDDDDQITAISVNDFYLAIMSSYITIYQLSCMKVVRVIHCPDAIGIKLFRKNQLISIEALDYVRIHSINNLREEKIYCQGSHTSISKCNGFHIISGSHPSILINNSIIHIDCEPFYDAVPTGPNEFAMVNFNSIQKIRLIEKGFLNQCSISAIPMSSFVRLNNNQYIYSRTIKEITYFFLNNDENPFYSCENFVCIGNAKSTLNIICKNSVIVFDDNLKKVNEMKFDKEILNFIVNHSKRYIYQRYSIIDLETKSPIFNSNEGQPISYVSMNHRYTVFLINDDTMVLFVVNDDNSYKLADMVSLYEHTTCVSLIGDIVLIGTQNSKILVMKIINNSKLERCTPINLNSVPTSIDKFENSFYVGLSSGSILELKIVNIDISFEKLVQILQDKMKCIAGLSKEDQYLAEKVIYDQRKGIVFDISILSKFVSLNEQEQKSILEDSFPVEEANKLLFENNNLFLS